MQSSLSLKRDTARPVAESVAAVTAIRPPPAELQQLARAAGLAFNGDQPWDIQVYDPAVYTRIRRSGSLGLGEAYMDGLWDSAQLDETLTRLLRFDAQGHLGGVARLRASLHQLRSRWLNRQSRRRAFEVAERHYDIGNDIYQAMLDSTMSYSCGYWARAETLEWAQQHKLDLICRKLALSPGERLLDIGCGWGGLVEHAARHYGIAASGITISAEQQRLARERCHDLPVDIRLMDYRDLDERYDKVVSVGMFEHVGPKNHAAFFRIASQALDDQGLFLLHTIGNRLSDTAGDPWMDRYIFPNGVVPSASQLSTAFEPWFVLEDWHNFGPDYERTLLAWWHNFERAWPDLATGPYDQRFYRMWKYYLHACVGYFRSRHGQLWQLVLSKPSRKQVYRSVR